MLGSVIESEKRKKRFTGLMKTYLFIDEIEPFKEISDFRELYDNLVSDEIAKDDAPDGVLFRKKHVRVNDGTHILHIGVYPETKIIEALNSLINYLEDKQHPELYRYMVAHYYYEYIHPFYDGNGRTGRLIICSYISRYLERYSAITLSYAINKNKSKYYKALEEVSSPLNRGEMTFYLIDMLELLSAGQEGIIEDLEMNFSKIERIGELFNNDYWRDQMEEAELFKIMIYLSVFTNETDFAISKLMDISSKSRYKINQIMTSLAEKGYVSLVKKRPRVYKVEDEFLEHLLIL